MSKRGVVGIEYTESFKNVSHDFVASGNNVTHFEVVIGEESERSWARDSCKHHIRTAVVDDVKNWLHRPYEIYDSARTSEVVRSRVRHSCFQRERVVRFDSVELHAYRVLSET